MRFCFIFSICIPIELRRNRPESQKDNQNQSWSQTGQRPPPGSQGEQGGPPPAKRLKSNPASQQQLTNSNPGTNPVSSHLSPQRPTLLKASQTQPSNLSCPNAPLPTSNQPQLPSTPFSHLQARIGESEGGTRWSLRQTLGQHNLARRIQGKERLALHLRQRVLSDRGEETELLTYQDNAEDLQVWRSLLMLLSRKSADCFELSVCKGKACHRPTLRRTLLFTYSMLQVDITMLADHFMDAPSDRLKQAVDTQSDVVKVGLSSDVKSLSGYLDEVER